VAAAHPWKKTPLIISVLESLVAPETAGEPMSTQKWVHSSLRTLSDRLKQAGHALSPPTVGRLLRKLDYSLRVNSKQLEARSNHPDRDVQFAHINEQITVFKAAGQPIISVDSKKKELIGDFKQAGQTWSLEPIAVNVHDFLGDSLGRAVPYGIYDMLNNRGTVYVGNSADTPAFAVDAIAGWWNDQGQAAFPTATQLLILADAGGSNSCRARLWKERLQAVLCDRLGLQVTVCHFPPGTSKWNPIEHRLFSFISGNCAGTPLRTWELFLAAIRGTPDRRSGAALRHISDRRDSHQRPHADAQPGAASYLSSLELHTPPSSTCLPLDFNTGNCSLTAP
jgi:hypothetical protein